MRSPEETKALDQQVRIIVGFLNMHGTDIYRRAVDQQDGTCKEILNLYGLVYSKQEPASITLLSAAIAEYKRQIAEDASKDEGDPE